MPYVLRISQTLHIATLTDYIAYLLRRHAGSTLVSYMDIKRISFRYCASRSPTLLRRILNRVSNDHYGFYGRLRGLNMFHLRFPLLFLSRERLHRHTKRLSAIRMYCMYCTILHTRRAGPWKSRQIKKKGASRKCSHEGDHHRDLLLL